MKPMAPEALKARPTVIVLDAGEQAGMTPILEVCVPVTKEAVEGALLVAGRNVATDSLRSPRTLKHADLGLYRKGKRSPAF
jgi:hypothetical protein